MAEFARKRNRLLRAAYVGRRWYFVTLCTGERRALFTDANLVTPVLHVLENSCSRHQFQLYAYCFMPDHLHVELVAHSESCDLATFIRAFKGNSAVEVRRLALRRLWQKGFYDHVLREGDDENAIAWYIFNNPVRKGLTQVMTDWPFTGSSELDWKRLVAPLREFIPDWKRQGQTQENSAGFTGS